MADLFLQGSSSDIGDFLSQMCDFAQTVAGFTRDDTDVVSRNGTVWTFGTSSMTMVVSGETLTTTGMETHSNNGPFLNHWFFTDPNLKSVHAVLETSAGLFNHLSFGSLTVFEDAPSGAGEYLTVGYPSATSTTRDIFNSYHGCSFMGQGLTNHINCGGVYSPLTQSDFSSNGAMAYFGHTEKSQQVVGTIGTASYYTEELIGGASSISQRAVLLPVYVFAFYTPSADWTPLGVADGISCVNLKYLLDKEITQDDWQVFPLSLRGNDNTLATSSGDYGYAYRRYVV